MSGLGKHDTARKGQRPFVIAYIKGDRRLADSGKTLDDARARIERRFAKPHNRGEVGEVYHNGKLVFTTAGHVFGWRVVYGETRPAWEKIFPTKREANAFAKKHRSFGDVIFSIARTIPGEPPQSMTAAIAAQIGGAA